MFIFLTVTEDRRVRLTADTDQGTEQVLVDALAPEDVTKQAAAISPEIAQAIVEADGIASSSSVDFPEEYGVSQAELDAALDALWAGIGLAAA